MQETLEAKGVEFYREVRLMEIHSDKNQNDFQNVKSSAHSLGNEEKLPQWDSNCNLERIILKDFTIKIDEEEEEEEMDIDEKSQSEHQNEEGHQDDSNVVDNE